MRNVWTTAVLVAVVTMSGANASPIASDTSTSNEAVSRADVAVTRSESPEASTLRVQSENKTDRAERQVLSRNFQSKPVQIYWFFGGR